METADEEIKRVCSYCVGEAFLKQRIHTEGTHGECSYCRGEGPTITIESLADFIDRAFEEHYFLTDSVPDGWEYAIMRDPDIDYDWERKGEEAAWAIAEAAGIDEEIAEDVRLLLEERHEDFEAATMGIERPFEEDSHFLRNRPDEGEFPQLWRQFEDDLKTKARYFSRSAHGILDQIFQGVEHLKSTSGSPVVVAAGPETEIDHLFRARVFQNEESLLELALASPWLHLGTPPSHCAGAGRMNARGIAVFYGARDAETAVKEVRPPVGSKVAVARFNLLRPLRLLDLRALASVESDGSIFDPTTIMALQKASFLELLSHAMSRAVMPHEEVSEYLPTQAVADFLGNELELDGIVFPSVQSGHQASNVVLFHRAARVQAVNHPAGTEVRAGFCFGDPDDPTPEYWVSEEVPALPDELDSATPPMRPFEFTHVDFGERHDGRTVTLEVDLKSIEIRLVNAVNFKSEVIPVSRRTYSNSNMNHEIL